MAQGDRTHRVGTASGLHVLKTEEHQRAMTPRTDLVDAMEISRLGGTPVSLSVKADQAGLKTEFFADFSGESVHLRQDGKLRELHLSPGVVLGFGSEKRIASLLKSTSTAVSFPFFSSDIRGVMTRTVQKRKQEKGDSDRTYRLELKDVSGNTELKQEILVDESGRPLYVKSRMMGLTIEIVSDKTAETVKTEPGKSTDILIQTLFHAKQWFPSGFDVRMLAVSVSAGEQQMTIPQSDFQSVSRKGPGVTVTITRPELTDSMKPDRKAAALESGPIVQSDLPEIKKLTADENTMPINEPY